MSPDRALVDTVQRLSLSRDLPALMEVLRTSARALSGADGVTVVLRDVDQCHYVDEDAIAPLWKGKKFPMTACISGWAMLNRAQVSILDIYQDARIPHDAYRPTFVKSLAMTPIRTSEPIGAIGAYWATQHQASGEELATLQALGDAASVAFENVKLIESLTQANRAKDDFLLMLAHELRNPLVPVRNATHVLKTRASAGDEATSQAHAMIERQMSHLERILGDLLDVGSLTRGTMQLRRERIDLARIVRTCVDDARGAFADAGVTLESSSADASVWMHGDATRLSQAIGNVLDNARKYTPAGGSVRVSLQRSAAGCAAVKVEDSGEGIDAETLPRVFDAFAQADRSLARTKGGLGLGLSLARGIVEGHGGAVGASSAGAGQGAEFTLTLPVEPAVPVAEPPRAQAAGSGTKVLIVEDNKDAAESLRMILQFSGYAVSVAHTGPDGVMAAQRTPPDVVVCDIGLPGFDGFEVAERLRADAATRHVRLIAVTGYGSEADKARSREVGFDVHLVKPVPPDRLLAQLTQLAAA